MKNREYKKIDVIGVQMDLGAATRGVNMGPYAIRYAGLNQEIKDLGYELEDRGDILPLKEGRSEPLMRNVAQVHDINKKLYEQVSSSLKFANFPVILGGDHSIAAGSISATAKHYQNIGVIWIDAHGDWNCPDSSPSGNMHGMPFSAVCGAGPDEMIDFGQKPIFVDPKKCVQIAGRDIDSEERIRMRKYGITVFSIADIDREGMPTIIEKALNIAGKDTEGMHISFDIDAVTPEFAPGTGTRVRGGLTEREAFYLMETVCLSKKMLALDMVEVNPMLDVRNTTGDLACRLILSGLGKTVY